MRIGYHPEPLWWYWLLSPGAYIKRLLNHWSDKDADV